MFSKDLENDIKDLLAKERDHFKKLIFSLKLAKDKCLKEENDAFTEEIMDGYKIAITEVILEEIVDKFQQNSIDEIWGVLEDIDLPEYFEPSH